MAIISADTPALVIETRSDRTRPCKRRDGAGFLRSASSPWLWV